MSAAKAGTSAAADQRNKMIAAAFFVLMIGIMYYEWQDSGSSTPAPAAAVSAPVVAAPVVKGALPPGNTAGSTAKTVGTTSAALDPTLHMQSMLVTEAVMYTGSGRNIFAAPGEVEETAVIPKVVAPVRTNVIAPPVNRGPVGPTPPPPIELKFFGMVTSADGHRQAMLLHQEDVFLASKGDIVQRKYRVIDIGPNSIQVEDMTNNNRQTLPLQATP